MPELRHVVIAYETEAACRFRLAQFGFAADIAMDPFTWIGGPHDTGISIYKWSKFGLNAISTRERLLDPIDQIKKTALDPYATFRSLYRQHRAAQIKELQDDHRATIPIWFPQPKDTPAQ